jgi:site-specific DNA-methyltransferase (adenine-specific)
MLSEFSEDKLKPVFFHGNAFFNEDCITGAKEHLADNSVDLIITDPPYGINGDRFLLHSYCNEEIVIDGHTEVPTSEYAEFSKKWILQAERVLKPGGCIYIVSGYTNLYYIFQALKKTNLKEINHIIWKYNFGVYTKKKFVSSHYHILYYQKPGGYRTFNVVSRFGLLEKSDSGRSLNYADREDVWEIAREYKPGMKKNENSLPLKLLVKMLLYSSNEGDFVCDFFLGSFSTAKAAIGLNRKVIGFENSESIFENNIKNILTKEPGFLMGELRQPITGGFLNQGKPWNDGDRRNLYLRFNELRREGKKKCECIEILQEEFGRGYWSIKKMLSKM